MKEIIFYLACAVIAVVPLIFVVNKVYEDGVLGRAFLLLMSFCAWMYLIERLTVGAQYLQPLMVAFFVGAAGFLCWHLVRWHRRVLRRKHEDKPWPQWVPH